MSTFRYLLQIGLASGVLLASSCNSLVDVKPRFNIPTAEALATATDLEAAVNGAFVSLQATGSLGVAMRLVPEIITDNVQLNDQAQRNGQQLYFGAYQRNLFATADNVWRDGYSAIERANNVIYAIQNGNVRLIDQNYLQNRSRFMGEALFVRGIMHFELVRLYGHQYGYHSDDEQSGVIIRTTPTADRVGLPRNTVNEVYKRVIEDLRMAIDSLPEDYNPSIHPTSYGGRVGGRATKDAAKAYLAKVYFQMATPAANLEALSLINQVMGSTPGGAGSKYWNPAVDQINSRDDNFFFKSGNNAAAQTIFQIVNTYNPATNELSSTAGGFLNAYISASLDPTDPSAAPFPVYVTSQQWSSKYFPDAGFKRQLLYSRKFPGSQYYIFKFLRKIAQPATINIPIIRGAEMLLTRAELLAYQGQTDNALADLNAVRLAGGLTALVGNPSLDDLIKSIAKERIIELAYEGDRFFDFKRRNQLDATLYTPGAHDSEVLQPGGYSSSQQPTGTDRIYPTLRWDAKESLLQIPDAEVFSNATVKRNL